MCLFPYAAVIPRFLRVSNRCVSPVCRWEVRAQSHPSWPGTRHHGLSSLWTLRTNLQTWQLCLWWEHILLETSPKASSFSPHQVKGHVRILKQAEAVSLCRRSLNSGCLFALLYNYTHKDEAQPSVLHETDELSAVNKHQYKNRLTLL